MLVISLLVNALIVFPVSIGMLTDQPGMDAVFGAKSDARTILESVYLAIGLISVAGLVAIGLGQSAQIIPMAAGLLILQIVYKLITVTTVGISSPVVLTNLAVVAVHTVTLVTLARQASP